MSVVSSALSRVSTRSSPWKISPRLASFMDSIFAIGFGLGLRFVVDAVSQHDFKLTGTLVGLWEGIILLHFLKKMPKSTDPYVAYAVRLFVDFLCTESVARLVLVLIWTGMGMVLADITPALWDDVGLNRIWRRFRRDLYTLFRMIPTVAFFPPPRTVRFSPSREPSIIIEEPSVLDSQPPSIITTEQTATTPNTVPATTITSSAPAAREVLRRRVPGYFPADYSDTDTDLGSIRAGPSMGRTSRRLSVYPQVPDYDSVTDLSSANDLDEANLSSGASSASTERAGPSSITFDTAVIPDMEEEEEEEQQQLLVDTTAVPAKDEEERTPRQPASMYLPPTPSDSALRWRPRLEPDEPLPVRPFSSLPQIPDFLEEPTTEDLEKIQPPAAEKPPTPPAKDDLPSRFAIPPVPSNPPPEPRRAPPSPEAEWELLNPFAAPEATTSTNRQSLPPAYRESEEFDDIYGEEYVAPPPATTAADAFGSVGANDKGKGVDLGAQARLIDDGITSPLGAPFNLTFGGNAAANPWNPRAASGAAPDLFDAARQEGEEKERLKLEAEAEAEAEDAAVAEAARLEEEERVAAEAAAAKQKEEERIAAEAAAAAKEAEEEAERKRKEDEAAAEKERQEEELRKKEEEEKAERRRKEEADELARQQRRLEKEAAEKKKAEEEEAARKADEQRKEEEEKQRKAEEEEATRKAEEKRIKEEKQQRKLERARKAEEKKKKEEEALAVKKAEEAEAARIAQEAVKEQRRKDTEAAAARREKARLEREEKEKQDRETAEAAAQEAEEKRKQEEHAKAKADEEAAEAAAASAAVAVALEKERQEKEEQMAKEEADKLKEAQTEAQQQQEETPAATTTGAADPTSSQDAQQALDNTPKRNQRDLPPTPTSPEPTNGQLADETITPEDPVQANELEESPNDADDQESVVTDASAMPSDVGIRLQRLLLAKAQMIDVRDRIEELKRKLEIPEEDHASISEQLKVDEKILKKMEKKEQRRYDEGVASHLHLSSMDAQDSISYGTLNPKDTGLKTEEKLEELMRPGVKALTITLIATTGRKGPGAKQKSKLIETLEDYNLFNNAREDINNGRTLHVNLPEEEFRQWLLDYRAAVTAPQDDLYS